MASLIYNEAFYAAGVGRINFNTDTFKVLLCTSGYTPAKSHDFRNDITNEVVAAGYTAGGAVATVSITRDDVNDRIDVALGAVNWTVATITALYAVYYKSRGGASSADELIAVVDFGGNIVSTGGTFAVGASIQRLQN